MTVSGVFQKPFWGLGGMPTALEAHCVVHFMLAWLDQSSFAAKKQLLIDFT